MSQSTAIREYALQTVGSGQVLAREVALAAFRRKRKTD
jgi:hypothetical protein